MFFGLTELFSAIKRLAASISRTADLFDAANRDLEQRLAVRDLDPKPLPPPDNGEDDEDLGIVRPGSGKKAKAKS